MTIVRNLAFVFFNFLSVALLAQERISIIPEPVQLVRSQGTLAIPSVFSIHAGTVPEARRTAQFLESRLNASGMKVTLTEKEDNVLIRFHLNTVADPTLGSEGYHLQVNQKNVLISANKPAGLFYAAQSLLQLFPKEIEAKKPLAGMKWHLPCVDIKDYPRFGWRGLMFDVSRHFFTKQEVKDFIDNMVKYKYNLLHLHLADDEGWRIEIKSFPRLTEVGAWRVKKTGQFGTFSAPLPNEVKDYGGFFTQQDLKEIIKYASDNYVNILPEIDVPGHSLAAVASYPELSCTPGAEKYNVRAGEPIMDWSRGAPPTALLDNTLCPANEKVYAFLDSVISEVAALFPFDYIHMGGDEAPHNFWQKNPQIQELMKKEGLKTMEQVQGYFTRRVETIVQSKGKKFIGWDEILEGGPSQSTAIMSWRGMEGGIKAAKQGQEVVMAPLTHAYVDLMQGDIAIEPRNYGTVRLNKAYQFNPTEGIDRPDLVKGGQANLWTEQIYNTRHLQYMLFPRALAIAESVWSPLEKKNWQDFYPRVEEHFKRFDAAEIKYSPAMYDPIFLPFYNAETGLMVEMSTELPGLDIYYSFDNSFPDKFYPKYSVPLVVPKDAGTLKVITYRDDKPIGRMITVQVADLKARTKRKS